MEKVESCHIGRCYYVIRDKIRGNYCPETGEYYLASYDKEHDGEYVTRVTYWHDESGYIHMYSARGYSYQVVRELLRLGHLTPKTLAEFREAGGEVWWNQ